MESKSGARSALRMNLNRGLEVNAEPADPDIPLVREFQSGQTMAFDRLYDRYSTYVYNTCVSMLGDADDARDAMQDTFVQVYRSLPKFLGQSKFSTWVYRITVNKCLDALRRRPRYEVSDSLEIAQRDGEPADDGILEAEVRSVILRLPEEYRALLVLCYFQQLSYQEIAEAVGCSVDQVRMKLHRARKAFRRLYPNGDGKDEM
jgi:RNA polymerase sigma-70 factor, ECF subfamily